MRAHALERLREPGHALEPHVTLRERPRREVDVRVGEPGKDAPAAEVDDVGLGSAVSCVPTPPATRSPAIASARAIGSDGSIVRTTPFSRIIRGRLYRREERRMIDHVNVGVQRPRAGEGVLREGARAARVRGRTSRRRAMAVLRRRGRPRLRRRRDADRAGGAHVGFTCADRGRGATRFYEAALAAGGTDNGAPGLRPQYDAGYYAAYVLDPGRQQHRGDVPRGVVRSRPRLRPCPGSR